MYLTQNKSSVSMYMHMYMPLNLIKLSLCARAQTAKKDRSKTGIDIYMKVNIYYINGRTEKY